MYHICFYPFRVWLICGMHTDTQMGGQDFRTSAGFCKMCHCLLLPSYEVITLSLCLLLILCWVNCLTCPELKSRPNHFITRSNHYTIYLYYIASVLHTFWHYAATVCATSFKKSFSASENLNLSIIYLR